MTEINNSNTYNDNNIFEIEYENIIKQDEKDEKNEKNLSKNKRKFVNDEFRMLTMSEYALVKTNKYKVSQLKDICKFYKLKKTGNKDELISRIYVYLKQSLYTIKIQKRIRGNLLRKYISLAGPAFKKRELCINDTDFASLEPIIEIPFNQFFSFSDKENNIYGCDIISLYGLLCKNSKIAINKNKIHLNPYTRESINKELIDTFSLYLQLAKVNKVEHVVVEEEEVVDPAKQIEFKIIEIFQYINELGNYADSKWFSNLSKNMTVIFVREMYDIWNYRAQLTTQVMRDIVPPHGNPFTGMNLHLAQSQPDEYIKKQAIRIIDLFIKSGYTQENRSLGAYYVLSALTLVSEDARIALPWLFQSVAH